MTPYYIIDFDSTIISCESLDELAAVALQDRPDRDAALSRLQDLTNLGMAGKLAFDESLKQRLELFAPADEHIQKVVADLNSRITPSFWRHRAWLKQNADRIYVISGGFEECIVPIVKRLGLLPEHVFANAFVRDQQGTITGHDTSRYLSNAGGKITQVAALQLDSQTIAIGDGYTDYEIRKSGQADEFWYFAENIKRPMVMEQADRILSSFDEVIAYEQEALLQAA